MCRSINDDKSKTKGVFFFYCVITFPKGKKKKKVIKIRFIIEIKPNNLEDSY